MIIHTLPTSSPLILRAPAATTLTQKLRNLIDAIVRFFQSILPCFFRRTSRPILPPRIELQQQTLPIPTPPIEQSLPLPQPEQQISIEVIDLPSLQPIETALQTQAVPEPEEEDAAALALLMQRASERRGHQEREAFSSWDLPVESRPLQPGEIRIEPYLSPELEASSADERSRARLKSFVDFREERMKRVGKAHFQKEAPPLTSAVQALLRMSSRERRQILAQTAPVEAIQRVEGTQTFEDEMMKGAIFIALEGLKTLWTLLEEQEDITPLLLNEIQERGLKSYSEHAALFPLEERLPFQEIIASKHFFQLIELLPQPGKPPFPLQGTEARNNIGSIADELEYNGEKRPLLAAILIEKNNTYGVIVRFNHASRNCDFYVIDPYGTEDQGPLSIACYTKSHFKSCFFEGHYSFYPLDKQTP